MEIPWFVQYEVTYSCNARCVFCYNRSREKPPPFNKIEKILASLKREEIPHIQLTGGEISTVPSIGKVFQLVKQFENSVFSVVTNGYLKLNVPSNVLSIFISLHGDLKLHQKLTGCSREMYRNLLRHIKEYVSEGFDVNCDTILCKYNYDKLKEIAEMAYHLGFRRMFVNKFELGGIGSGNKERLRVNIEEMRNAVTQMVEINKKYRDFEILFGTSVPYCIDERIIKENLYFTCGAGEWSCAIDPKGNVRICNQGLKVIGNILKENLEKIWREKCKIYKNLEHLRNPCTSCSLKKICKGGCFVHNVNGKELLDIDYLLNDFTPDFEKLKILWKKRKRKKYLFGKDRFRVIKSRGKFYILSPRFQILEIPKEVYEYLKNKEIVIKNKSVRKLFAKLGII